MAGFDDDLRFAHVLADAADDITMRRFRALDLSVQAKPDLTPVTDADLATEESLRNVLRRARPRDAMLGEEYGQTGGTSSRCWVIDPIDGTKNFVRGVPVWATLVALMADQQVTVGVVSAPARLAVVLGPGRLGGTARRVRRTGQLRVEKPGVW
jgi:histidinol-phosphatase